MKIPIGTSNGHNTKEEAYRSIKKLGFDYIEYNMEMGDFFKNNNSAFIKKIIVMRKKHNLHITAHAPFRNVTLSMLNNDVRQKSVELIKKSIHILSRIGTKLTPEKKRYIIMHPGISFLAPLFFKKGIPKDFREKSENQVRNALIKSCKELVVYANKKDTVVCLENMLYLDSSPEYFGRNIEELLPVFENVKGLRMCLDIGHANAMYGRPSTRRIVKMANRLSEWIDVVHAHENDGKGDQHLPISGKLIDFKPIIKKIDPKLVTLEIFPQSESKTKNLSTLKKSRIYIEKILSANDHS